MGEYYGHYDIIDSHVHPFGGEDLPGFLESAKAFIDDVRVSGVNLLCINNNRYGSAGTDLFALALKTIDPRFTVYGGFGYWMNTMPSDGRGLKTQLETYLASGFDGLKMLEGKPTERAVSGIPLDDSRYDPAFDLLEKTGFHIVSHVNDPEEFWDEETCPKWANGGKGGYWDTARYLTKEQHYTENEKLLARHPNINITFAHAYFLSNFPDRMTALLDKYPNVTIDLCPGIEMYDGFTRRYDAWREIFMTYGDRFLFGTDNVIRSGGKAGGGHDGTSRYKITNIVRFLADSGEFEAWNYRLRGMKLPPETVKKILSENYLRVRGPVKVVDKDAAASYGEALYAEVKERDDIGGDRKKAIADAVSFFKGRGRPV